MHPQTTLPILLVSLMLCACAAKVTETPQEDLSSLDCPTVYVYAPGNYIIDVAGGAEVILDPLVRDFPLFCSSAEAALDLSRQLTDDALPDGDWRIYTIEGEIADIGQRSEDGRLLLNRMTAITDWVDIGDI
jgi:hypothetical protein